MFRRLKELVKRNKTPTPTMFMRLKELVKRKKTPAPVAKPNLPANMLRAIAQQETPAPVAKPNLPANMLRAIAQQDTPAPVAKPNLQANMLRAIAQQASPSTRRSMMHATTTIPRRQMPIGLAVTKVGLPMIPKNRPPVLNRSRATAKTPALKYSSDVIDQINPVAYKNNTWKYYLYLTTGHIAFANTRNGQPFEINKKTGARKPIPARLGFGQGPLQGMKPRNPVFHTWNAYQKRAMRNAKLRSGKAGRTDAYLDVNQKVRTFLNGNQSALNNVPYSRLIWWAQLKNWMTVNGRPYVKREGKWYRYSGGNVVSKNNVIHDIELFNSLR